jgi:hypothetical protein
MIVAGELERDIALKAANLPCVLMHACQRSPSGDAVIARGQIAGDLVE